MMPKPGDVCESCRPRWEKKNKEPKVLVASTGKTNKGEYVTLCPYCDGGAVDITKLDLHDPLQDA